MAPTETLPLLLSHIIPRQDAPATATVTVVPDPGNGSSGKSGLDTGAIVGIVIGVVVAILLIIWAIRSLSSGTARAPDSDRQGWYDDDIDRSYPPRHRHGRHHHGGVHGRNRSRSHHSHHHRHRSSTPRPVVLEEKDGHVRRPSATYVYPDTARRSRSQRRSR